MIALLCAALSGAMFYLSQGLDDVWALAWVAPLPLLWLAYGAAPGWRPFAASLAAYAAGQIYLFQTYGDFLPVAALAATALGNGALFAGAVAFARRVHRARPLAALVAFPAAWAAVEYLESLASPHGAWGALGYSQASYPAAIQIASLLGAPAVTFTLCLAANALALTARGVRGAGWLGACPCLLALGFGHARLREPGGERVKVAALADQGPAFARAFKGGDQAASLAVAQGYAAAVRAEAEAGARVFVTPETGVEEAAVSPLAQAAKDAGGVVIVGAHGREPARNMALAFSPDGRVTAYDKRHRLLPGEAVYTPGRASGLIGDGLAVAICKDLDFPRTIRADARRGGIRLMAVPANDFVKDDWVHARQAVMRGVENGFAVVRSAFDGLETVSDAQGRVLARARVDRPGLIVTRAEVPLGPGPTPYTRAGDWFAWLCVALSFGLAPWALKARRRPA